MPNELTVAAANFNIDFSLMKVEAPKEFFGVRDALSRYKRGVAEEGLPHVIARRLGALFEAIVPSIPHLIQAYGNRVSSISSRLTAKTQKFPTADIFADQSGPDGTNIWAAATSGRGALAVHLLACMLARIWKRPEAISLWVELVERRKEDILNTYNNYNATETAAILAAQQIFNREQLATWDSSARSWLQTADSDRNFQQTQLMLIINNVRMPVNTKKDPYKSVLEAWTVAMCAMEQLVQGVPQRIQDGAVLLAMSSWHLYPDIQVLVDETKSIDLRDELMNGSLITISAHGTDDSREGVFWSLPLGRMRYYSPPVVAERHLASDTSRVSLSGIWMVILGTFVSHWEAVCPGPERCCKFIIHLSDRVDLSAPSLVWLKFLAAAARSYADACGVERDHFAKLLGLGIRWGTSFLNDAEHEPLPLFGLGDFSLLVGLIPEVENQIKSLRKIAESLQVSGDDVLVRYQDEDKCHIIYGGSQQEHRYCYASALPLTFQPSLVRHRCDSEPPTKRQCKLLAKEHARWVISKTLEPEISCEGASCGCILSDRPSCFCTQSGVECTPSCHQDGSQCSSGISVLGDQVCVNNCPGEGQCAACSDRLSKSKIEGFGERCFVTSSNNIRILDKWHFLFTKPHDEGEEIMYDFLLGDVDTMGIFKKNESRLSRYCASGAGSPATVEEIENLLVSDVLCSTKLQSYLENWWKHGIKGHDIVMQHELSLKALAYASSLYEPLDGATISLEVLRRPLYEARWAQQLHHYHLPQSLRPSAPRPPQPFRRKYRQYTDYPNSTETVFDMSTIDQTNDPWEVPSEESINIPSHAEIRPQSTAHNMNSTIIHPGLSTYREDKTTDIEERLAISFACIAMFESGEFNIDPQSLLRVMALASGDSIYVASALLCDPGENTYEPLIQRVFGNLGRSEIALLLPPSNPRLKDHDFSTWHLINHKRFDGKFQDHFAGTSLHLSFTDFEMPVDIGTRGLRDTQVVLIESLISINDKGRSLGDLDIVSMLQSELLTIMHECSHRPTKTTTTPALRSSDDYDVISIDCWDEFFDLPRSTGIVRAHGNWQARLAGAAASIQRQKRTLVLPENPCIQCLASYGPLSRFDIIIA